MEDPPVVIQTPYPADLDPLDTSPRHLSLTILDLNAKDPLSMVTERSVWVSYPRDVRGVTSEKHMP